MRSTADILKLRNRRQLLLTLAMVTFDLFIIILSVRFAYYLRFETKLMPYIEFHPWQAYIGFLIIEMIVFPWTFALRGLYQPKRTVSRIDELQRIFTSVSIGTVIAWAISSFLYRDFVFSRALTSFAWLSSIILLWFGRLATYWIRQRWLYKGPLEDRVLIVGTGEMAQGIKDKIQQSPELGYRAVGFVNENNGQGNGAIGDLPVLGGLEDIEQIIREFSISEIIIAEPSLSHKHIVDIVSKCDREHVSIKVFPDVFQIISSDASIGDLNGLPMITVKDIALRGWNLTIKRAIDILISVMILTLLSPVMLLISLLIKLTSPGGPVLYVQERVGLDDGPFDVIKFRSMKPDAEQKTGPVWARRGDNRTTILGRLLRRTSLDELPQFVNVLLGQMSVVGPRPERPYFVEQFSRRIPRYTERHRLRAGLTGWAQVNGLRGNVSIEERTAYDLWYVENWNLWLDVKIMLKTLFAIFRDKNAY